MARAMPLTAAVCLMAFGDGSAFMAIKIWQHHYDKGRPFLRGQPTRKSSGRSTQPDHERNRNAIQEIRRVKTDEVPHQLMDRLQAISSQLSTILAVVQDIADSAAQATVPPVLSPKPVAASLVQFVSDSSKVGHAVFCFDLPLHPFIFIRNINASQWRELHNDVAVLEARAISLTLEHLLSKRDLRKHLDGAIVSWVSDNQGLVQNLSLGPCSLPSNAKAIAIECHRIFHAISLLQITVKWVWSRRDRPAMKLAHQLSRLSSEAVASAEVKATIWASQGPVLADLATMSS